jgi:prepilin-type N-terminal cleavage/methylation domain-containing protein
MTLIEVVVATAILGFGLAAVYAAIGASMQARKYAHDHYLGTLLANNALEAARATAFSDLASINMVSAIAIDENGVPDDHGRFRKRLTIVTPYNGNPGIAEVTATIQVPRPRSQGSWGSVSVSTLLIDLF